MTAVHIVKPGEHIAAIATRFGFENFTQLWEHPNNAELKQRRKSPFLLAVGDELFIPDRVRLEFTRATAASHDFRAHIDRLDLKLRLLGFDAKPQAETDIVVEVERPESGAASSARRQELKTDASGRVAVEISKACVVGGVTITGLELELQIGALEPIDTDLGLAQRLTNLGYFVPTDELERAAEARPAAGSTEAEGTDAEGAEQADEEESDDLRSAIEEFQCDQGLTVNGKKDDPAMLAKLEELHGS